MRVLIHWNHNEILFKNIGLPGPALDPVVSPHGALFFGLDRRGFGGQAAVPEGSEHVHPREKIRD